MRTTSPATNVTTALPVTGPAVPKFYTLQILLEQTLHSQ